MRWWLVAGVLALAAAVAVALLVDRTPVPVPAPPRDPVVDDFRATERVCLAAFNAALARQRANEIDELELAGSIERDALVPWRAMRARIEAAPGTAALYTTMRRYAEARQIAWEAYAAGLRADSEPAARPHYDIYHQRDAEADAAARELGRMFRGM